MRKFGINEEGKAVPLSQKKKTEDEEFVSHSDQMDRPKK